MQLATILQSGSEDGTESLPTPFLENSFGYQDPPFTCMSCEKILGWKARHRALHLTPTGAQLSVVDVSDLQGGAADNCTMIERIEPACSFIMHENCFFLLKSHFADQEINLDRLLEVSLEIPFGSADYTDGDGRYVSQRNFQFEPLKRPVILGLRSTKNRFPKRDNRAMGSRSNLKFIPDGFSSLAIELRQEIASLLSTNDFLNLRSSSRAMVPVFDHQIFWKSRFRINGDRGFLNCLVENPEDHESKNWRLIYKVTAKIQRSDGHLWELRRRWLNNLWLRKCCSMTRVPDEEIVGDRDVSFPPKPHRKECHTELCCYKQCIDGDYGSLGRVLSGQYLSFVQTIGLESAVISLAVSVLREGGNTYITGFELISADLQTPNATFGYRLPGEQVIIDIRNTKLRGFTLVKGRQGFHAIRPILNRPNQIVSWIGQPKGRNVSKPFDIRLPRGIRVLWGKFDSYKMIGLCIA